jgi:hypothetical protein
VRRHETDAVALTFALIFLGIAGAWLMVAAGAADVTGLRYFFPVLLLGAGGAGVATTLLRGRAPADAVSEGGPESESEEGAVVDTPGGQT